MYVIKHYLCKYGYQSKVDIQYCTCSDKYQEYYYSCADNFHYSFDTH